MKNLRYIWIVAIIAFLVGLIGLFDRLMYGQLSTNTGSNVSWGLWVSCYIYFSGLSAGAFLLSAIIYITDIERLARIGRLALFSALACFVMAMLSIWFDIGHPIRSLQRFYISPNFQSPMGVVMLLYLIYAILITLELFCAVYYEKRGLNSRRVLFGFAVVGIPLALVFSATVGAIFGVLKARPFWQSGMTPIIFVVEALLSGGALITVLAHFLDPARRTDKNGKAIRLMGNIILALLAFYVLCFLSELMTAIYGEPDQVERYRYLITGPYAISFWVGQVFMVIVIPALLLIIGNKSARCISLAALLIVLGFIAVRLNIVVPAQTVPLIKGIQTAYIDQRLLFTYHPSLMEWLLELWIVSVGVIFFLIGIKVIPVFSKKTA